jgi:exopolyphosphatase/guanosine-5'-triphosphate,3'-diphosphate pyrophosphatase
LTSAIIDLGSNTVRMCIFDYKDGEIQTVFSQKEIVGLASHISDGKLPLEGIFKVCDVLRHLRFIALKFVPENEIFSFTTAAFRAIENRDEAFDLIRAETSMEPVPLSGAEEARLDFVAVRHATKEENGFLMDVGGASTELVRFSDGAIDLMASMPVGGLELCARHASSFALTKSVKKDIKAEIRLELGKFDWDKMKIATLIGVGGTNRTALKMSRELYGTDKKSDTFPAENIDHMIAALEDKNPQVFQALLKVAPDRIITFYPGLMILEEIIRHLRPQQIKICKYGVREGFYIDRVLKLNTHDLNLS